MVFTLLVVNFEFVPLEYPIKWMWCSTPSELVFCGCLDLPVGMVEGTENRQGLFIHRLTRINTDREIEKTCIALLLAWPSVLDGFGYCHFLVIVVVCVVVGVGFGGEAEGICVGVFFFCVVVVCFVVVYVGD